MTIRTLLTLPLLFAFAACGNEPAEHNQEGGNHEANENEKHNDGHGEAQALGELTAHGRSFKVTQFGHVEAGEEAAFELEFAAGKRIDTVRGWVGEESGKGSVKSPWNMEGETNLHGHVEVPAKLVDGAKLWMELEVDGKTETVSIAYK